ncbi:MAG TPA: hypothetical protein DEB40_13225 [Elusimicrobia bacterium]|nr:hypothetical protein [Elusimicrobiota bacterium]HBT62696.1 hypothetical protein [Elusimicrobiota bacterium]
MSSCIPYPGGLPEDFGKKTAVVAGTFPGLDAGAAELQSLHFYIRAYGIQNVQKIAEVAEAAYSRIMADTGLYSFKPAGLYRIVVYADAAEYLRKTAQPAWSGGAAVGNAIYSFSGPQLERVLIHEMTHLIFYEYMGHAGLDQRWINEGLAVYEEGKAVEAGSDGSVSAAMRPLIFAPMSLERMRVYDPAVDKDYVVSQWYAQAGNMMRFMVETGGHIGFSQFLGALRQGNSLDRAMAAGFPGTWGSLAEFEQAWRKTQPEALPKPG